MTKSDDVILEFLDEKGIAAPPMVISFNVDGISYPTVQRRVAELAANALLKRYDDPQGYVEITDKGRKYLRGDLDPDELK